MECKNGDSSTGDWVASWAADGGVGGLAGKTDASKESGNENQELVVPTTR